MNDKLEDFVPESLRGVPRKPPRTDYTMTREQFDAFTLQRRAEAAGIKPPAKQSALDQFCEFISTVFYAGVIIVIGWIIATSGGQGMFALWAACVIVGAAVGEMKGEVKMGLLWAAILGPIGLIVVIVMPNKVKVAQAAEQAAQQARLVQLQEAQLKELKELRLRLAGSPTPPPAQSMAVDPSPGR
jgi:hypothetical protein